MNISSATQSLQFRLANIFTYARQRQWQVGVGQFILLVTCANILLYQQPLYSFAVNNMDVFSFNGVLIIITLTAQVFFFTALVLYLLFMLSRHLVKPVFMLLALGNSIALYFVTTYQIMLDKSMMGNVSNTNFAEASDLFHPKLLLYILVLGVLPCWLMAKLKLSPTRRLRLSAQALVTFVLLAGWMYSASSAWLWFDKNNSRLGGLVMPWSYVVNYARYQTPLLLGPEKQELLPAATFVSNQKTVVVLVIGEAARARNFSLYGYERDTNPLLQNQGVAVLQNTTSCTTYTTASVRCILAHLDASSKFSKSYEPLPSYLQRHGIDVIWRTRNWGEPPIKVNAYQRSDELRKTCTSEDCEYDEVLLSGLAQQIESSTQQKVFVVIHSSGSHGPSYYKKYPQRFEKYTPVCESVELNQCSEQELINAYDNTILYTDYFLSQVIDILKSVPNAETAMLYVSDHGESLGEHGLYLHGTPNAFAPDVQKEIPFIVWASNKFEEDHSVSNADIESKPAYSQRNVFHSVMGAFAMRSSIYEPDLDIFNNSTTVASSQ